MTDKERAGRQEQEPGIPFPDEVAHLAQISRRLEDALVQAHQNVDQADKEYMDTKRYMVQHRGDIDPHEMFQNEMALRDINRTGEFAVGIEQKLEKLKDSPYFARIDFKENDSTETETYYIGRFTFSHQNDLLVYDWRAPVAGMFYDHETGPAGYEAPIGRIEGELERKRQLKIKGGKLEYAIESAVNIQDDVLQRELSRTSDEKMKSIIATIQKEQNQIIRSEKGTTLLIQGAAGSGKTSVALHRIAFLLYRFKDRLSAKNIAILSPNKVFGDYISNVLPELGEEPVYELSFTEIAQVQLEGIIGFEAEQDPLEIHSPEWQQRGRFKSTLGFLEQLNAYLNQMPGKVFEPQSCRWDRFEASGGWIQQRYEAYHKYPIKRRLQLIAEDMHGRFETENVMGDEVPGIKIILKQLTRMLRVKNSLVLYKDFYQQSGAAGLFVMPQKNVLEWADVFPFLYVHGAFEGLKIGNVIKHLVIDEMQDYTPVQYRVINILFPCQKTILGDFGQFLNPNHSHTLEDLKRIYQEAEFIELKQSYRSTYEIMTFAGKIQGKTVLPVKRHGEKPALLPCRDKQDGLEQLKREIKGFLKKGNASLGIIAKTNARAKEVFEQLRAEYDLHLITPQSRHFEEGISVTSVQMSKGLEFDEVIVLDAGEDTYSTIYDSSLLYIACTRAMHWLALLYTGKLSSLIKLD